MIKVKKMEGEKMSLLWGLYKESSAVYKSDDYSRLTRNLIFNEEKIINSINLTIKNYENKMRIN